MGGGGREEEGCCECTRVVDALLDGRSCAQGKHCLAHMRGHHCSGTPTLLPPNHVPPKSSRQNKQITVLDTYGLGC